MADKAAGVPFEDYKVSVAVADSIHPVGRNQIVAVMDVGPPAVVPADLLDVVAAADQVADSDHNYWDTDVGAVAAATVNLV